MNDCTDVREATVITPENMKKLTAEIEAPEDRMVTVPRKISLSELVSKVIRSNPNSGLGCPADILWSEVNLMTLYHNNINIKFPEVVKAVNLLLRQGKIRVRFDVNTDLNSVSFIAEKEEKANAS